MTAAARQLPASFLSLCRRGSRSRFARSVSWGLADQGLISIAGFVATVLLVRTLSPSGFGRYTLVVAIVLLSNAINTGLFTSPHNVLAATKTGTAYVRYTSTTFAAQIGVSGLAALLGLLVALAASALSDGVAQLVAAAAVTLFAGSLQNCARRLLYTETRARAAFSTDVIAYGGQIAAFVGLWRLGSLTATSAVYSLGGANAAGALLGGWQLRRSLTLAFDRSDLREGWALGRWLTANQIGGWLSFNVYLFLAAAITGARTSGAIRASQAIMGPLNVVFAFLPLVLFTRFAQVVAAGGPPALRREIRRTYKLTAPLFACYCLLVAVLAQPLLRLLYGSTYERYWPLVALLSLYFFLSYTAEVLGGALTAQRQPRVIFTAFVVSVALSFAVGWACLALFGATGAGLGLVANAVVLNVLLWRALRTHDAA